MPTDALLITTVIPTYRRPALLRRAITSALSQTRPVGTVAVYDDASGDETEAVVREIMSHDNRVTFHGHKTNLGLVANFRFALERVETPYFSILSNDDIVLPRLYEAGLAAFESHPEAAFVSTQVVHADDQERIIRLLFPWHPGVYTPPEGLLRLIEWGAPAWAGIIFRTSVLEEFGSLDPETGTLMDYDFQVRIAARKTYVVDPTPGAVFFHRRESISGEARLDGTWPAWLRLMEKLARDESVPPTVRKEGDAMLTQQLINRLYGIGVVSSRAGNFSDARQASDLLSDRYGEHTRASRIRMLAATYERVPALGRVHGKLSEWRQPYERSAWWRKPVTLDSFLAKTNIAWPKLSPLNELMSR
jgi:glycosyltransferase involved in cell wall biosynthesis